ncbi:MAG: tail fiber domain-containing protein [Ewingella sp.]|nr:tail fiber domain-containing protein [Ewingella sp.]
MTWYSNGTVDTTANSAVVRGTNTWWMNSGLRAGDMLLIGYSTASPRGYEIKSIDNDVQITLVMPFPVAASGAPYVGIPMLSGDRTAITMTLATQTSKAFTDNQAMAAVWQAFYTGNGTVTLTMPDGTKVTGSSFLKLTADMESKANKNDVLLKTGGTISGDFTVSGKTVLNSKSDLRFKGFTDSSRPNGANTNDLVVSTPSNAQAGAYACQMVYQWYADGWITGIKRNAGYGTNAFGIYFNGASTGAGKEWQFLVDGTAAGGAWVNGSDERHKSKIQDVANPLAAVCSWRGCSYEIKDGGSAVGLIAQDVEKFCPVAIKTYGDRKFSDNTVVKDFKYLDTTGVSAAYHTEAIKQLFALLELALEDPDACRAQIEAVKLAMIDVSHAEQAS